MNTPMLPMNIPKKLIREEADLVSFCCCSSIRLALGGLMSVIDRVAGRQDGERR